MKYIIIKEIEGYTSQQRCDAINKELWNITRPPNIKSQDDITSKVFSEEELLDGDYALYVDENYIIVVHSEYSADNLLDLYPNMSLEERNNLINYIENNTSFPYKDIIPQGTKLYTFDELVQLKLLEESEII